MSDQYLFDIATPLGFSVHVTLTYWNLIVGVKHPAMTGREHEVQQTLKDPDEIRESRSDPDVYLFYRAERAGRWICAVVRRLNGNGFLITTYPTDSIKEGSRLWQK